MRVIVLALSLCACGEPPGLTVFAAASLGPAMEEVAREHGGGARVVSAGSQVLTRQIEAGAPADVYAPADQAHADAIAPRLERSHTLICNRVVIASRVAIGALEELAGVDRLVVATPEAPLGAYTERVLAASAVRAAIEARIVSREIDARQVLARVLSGEADAAIVYLSDAHDTDLYVVPLETPELARYPIAAVREAAALDEARAFVAFARSPRGGAIFERHGFVRCAEGSAPRSGS